MKSKLGIIFILMCVASFFLYKMGEKSKVEKSKETLIEGVVVDAISNDPIKGVSIAVAGNNPRSVSDEDGKFMVFGNISDEFILKHPNYKSIIISGEKISLVRMEVREE